MAMKKYMTYDELYHHGIKGQKWGKKNGPPYPLGASDHSKREVEADYKESIRRARTNRAMRTKGDVDDIINSMSKDDRDKVLAGSDSYLSIEEGQFVAKRVLKKYGKIPVSFFDILEDSDDTFNLALGTRSGDEYRGKGYASAAAEQAMDWVEKNKSKLSQKQIIWGVRVDNIGSIRIAEKNGFELDENSYSDDGQWVNYVKKLK